MWTLAMSGDSAIVLLVVLVVLLVVLVVRLLWLLGRRVELMMGDAAAVAGSVNESSFNQAGGGL